MITTRAFQAYGEIDLLTQGGPAPLIVPARTVQAPDTCGAGDRFAAAAAVALGRSLALGGHTLVYGGAQVGLMGAVADAALAHGGRVVVSSEVSHGSEFTVRLPKTA